MNDLAARLLDAKGQDSIDTIVVRAHKAGHKINRATVARYIKGEGAKRPPDDVLLALAAGLSVDVRELRTLAGAPAGELGEWKPPAEAARLNRDQREALTRLIKTMVQPEGISHGAAATTQAEVSSAQEEYRLAAHPMKGSESVGRQARRAADAAGEESQDG